MIRKRGNFCDKDDDFFDYYVKLKSSIVRKWNDNFKGLSSLREDELTYSMSWIIYVTLNTYNVLNNII